MPTVNPPVVALVLALVPVLASGGVVPLLLEEGGDVELEEEGELELEEELGAARAEPATRPRADAAMSTCAGRMKVSLGLAPPSRPPNGRW
jgi:hypothetical protein